MLPPVHVLQLLHLTLAIIFPLETPDPSIKVTFASVSYRGITLPLPSLGERVTFWPSAEVYLRSGSILDRIARGIIGNIHDEDVRASHARPLA